MNVLAIDTHSSSGSIAISKDDKIVFVSYLDIRATHSSRLIRQIDYGLKATNILLDEIDLIVVCSGPGSFTGIRIGLSTAKGIAFGKNIPVQDISALDALAYNFFGMEKVICSFIDAKTKEIYACLYDKNLNHLINPTCVKAEKFFCNIKEPIIIVGDNFDMIEPFLHGINYQFALPHQNILLASTLISMAKARKYNFEDLSRLEPLYLRKSQAEIVFDQKLKN